MFRFFLVSLISVIFSFYLFETYLIYKNQSQLKGEKIKIISKKSQFEKKNNKNWDERSRLEIYQDLKKENSNIVIRVQPLNSLDKKNIEIFPLSGISNSETIHCNENGYYSIYKSDRYGFNNPDQEWDRLQIEFLLIGDSFTHGSCVNRPNDIASVLRKLSKQSVLNLGYGGNGPLIEYATLREYSKVNKIKNIIWIYNENADLLDLSKEKNNLFLKQYLSSNDFSQNLINKQNKIDKLLKNDFDLELKKKINTEKSKNSKKLKSDNIKYKILRFIRLDKTKKIFGPKYTNYDDILFEDFKIILEKTKKLSKEKNARLIFVYLPQYLRFEKKNYSNKDYEKIISIVKDLEIEYIDIKDVFEKEHNPKIFFPYQMFAWHYNEIGYQKVAETIYDYLNKN